MSRAIYQQKCEEEKTFGILRNGNIHNHLTFNVPCKHKLDVMF